MLYTSCSRCPAQVNLLVGGIVFYKDVHGLPLCSRCAEKYRDSKEAELKLELQDAFDNLVKVLKKVIKNTIADEHI